MDKVLTNLFKNNIKGQLMSIITRPMYSNYIRIALKTKETEITDSNFDLKKKPFSKLHNSDLSQMTLKTVTARIP